MIGAASICFSCSRWRGGVCSAYPRGIPDGIMFGGFDHRRPYGGEVEESGHPILWDETPGGSEDLKAWESLTDSGRGVPNSQGTTPPRLGDTAHALHEPRIEPGKTLVTGETRGVQASVAATQEDRTPELDEEQDGSSLRNSQGTPTAPTQDSGGVVPDDD